MDWLSLQQTLPREKRLPDRAFRLTALETVLDGTLYDRLEHPFSTEANGSGEYVPLDKRRPSVRTGLCRVVVDDAVSLLFSEGHWPTIKAKTEGVADKLTALSKATRLNEVMLEAATRGSVGSVAIRFRVLKNKPFFDVLTTAYLTPTWKADDPDTLEKVTERYLIRGADLTAMGYAGFATKAAETFWFTREWDEQDETWFEPVAITARDAEAEPRKDAQRSVHHGLGFVPIVWVRNLASARRDAADGACTFEAAIDTVIETDYLLSQGGRGLKYASDPTLVIKSGPGGADDEPRTGGAANALDLPPEGDAKLLEINGQSAKAVLEHVNQLRAVALESMHGNRTHSEKLSAATSGRSIELMMSGLIWLADRLRTSYGEGALLSLLAMVCLASQAIEGGLIVGDETLKGLDPAGLELRWAPWMPPMPHDLLESAQALVTAKDGGVLSQETASARFGALVDVDDAADELKRIQAEAETQRQAEEAAADAAATRAAANLGRNTTRELTA